jgi:choline dehydrogenase
MKVFTASFLVAAAVAVSAAPVQDTYDYIVVGSGAGGGPLASRLARSGSSVLLIEAGNDQGTNYNYTVPGYQAAVTQDPQIAWDVYVNHYQDQERARRDPKYVEGKGVLYPRAGTLGGCVR